MIKDKKGVAMTCGDIVMLDTGHVCAYYVIVKQETSGELWAVRLGQGEFFMGMFHSTSLQTRGEIIGRMPYLEKVLNDLKKR